MSTPLGSTVESIWRAARDAVVRLNHLLAETGNSDDDLVFHIRRTQSDAEVADPNRSPRTTSRDELHS